MTFELQGNEVQIVSLGGTVQSEGTNRRKVTFSVNGKQFERDILLGDETGQQVNSAEEFYTVYEQQITSSLIDFFSANHQYNND